MPPVNPTSTIYRLSSNEIINTGNALLGDIHEDDTTDFTEASSPQQTETPKQTQKAEMKENKFSYDKLIHLLSEIEKLSRKVKREQEEDRDHFAEFAEKNIELKASLKSIVTIMSSKLTYDLIGQESDVRDVYESHVRNINLLLRQWENTLEDYDIIEILPVVGEDYRKYEKLCTIDKESIDTDDPQKDETIAKVLEKGYRLESRVLYKARICIHKYKPVA